MPCSRRNRWFAILFTSRLKFPIKHSPVLTSLNVTLFCVFSASFRLGCTKSFSAPPLDEAAILLVALELNPRHAKIRRFGLVGSGKRNENFLGKRKSRKRKVNNIQKHFSSLFKRFLLIKQKKIARNKTILKPEQLLK